MTGYTAGATRTAEQERWSNYYLMRDIQEAGPALYLLGSPTRVPVVQGVDSTVVDAVLPAYHPVDTRSKRARRDDRARAYRSKAYYSKTYIVPKSQLIWASMIGIGASMMVGAGVALAALHL